MNTLNLVVTLCFLVSTYLGAQEPTISLALQNVGHIKKSDGTMASAIPTHKNFTIVATINNSGGSIEIAGLDNFEIFNRSQSSNFLISNDTQSTQRTLSVTAQANTEGSYTIGPAKITVDGKTVTSNTVTLEVNNKAQPPAQQVQQAQQTPASHQSNSQTDVFCKLTVDQDHVVVGQPITLRCTIYTRSPLDGIKMQPPTFNNCTVKEITEVKVQNNVKIKNNMYRTLEKTFILVPIKEGALTIDPITIHYAVPMARNRESIFHQSLAALIGLLIEKKSTQSNDLKITVLPLPPHNSPIDGIGEFYSFKATIDKQEAVINEPIKLTLTIDGKGNLEQIAIPKLSLPPNFKYYDSKTSIQENLEIEYTGGTKQCEYVLQINRAGSYQIPAQAFTFYDTQAKAYKTLKTNPLDVVIKPGDSQSPLPPQTPEQQQQNQQPEQPAEEAAPVKDICFIIEAAPLHPHDTPQPLPTWLMLLLLLAPVFIVSKTPITVIKNIAKKIAGNPSAKAIDARFAAGLKQITKQNNTGALYQFFIHFFATRTNTNISTVTENWIEEYLVEHKWTQEKINEFLAFMSACAQIHFSKPTQVPQATDQLFKKAQYWLLILSEK